MLDRTSLTFLNGASVMQQICVTVTVFITLAIPDIFQGCSNVNMTILDNDDLFLLG